MAESCRLWTPRLSLPSAAAIFKVRAPHDSQSAVSSAYVINQHLFGPRGRECGRSAVVVRRAGETLCNHGHRYRPSSTISLGHIAPLICSRAVAVLCLRAMAGGMADNCRRMMAVVHDKHQRVVVGWWGVFGAIVPTVLPPISHLLLQIPEYSRASGDRAVAGPLRRARLHGRRK